MRSRSLCAAGALVAALLVLTSACLTMPAANAVPVGVGTDACRTGRVALTFDDGPGEQTPKLVRILRDKHVRATFFVLGQKVAVRGPVIRRMVGHGHVVANHTWDHQKLTTLSSRKVRREYRSTTRIIDNTGAPRPQLARPPYGSTNARIRRITENLGLHQTLWTVDTNDWNYLTPRQIVHRAVSGVDPGGNIVLLHDGVVNSASTVSAVPRIIHRLRERGYCMVPLNVHGAPQRRPSSSLPKLRASDVSMTEGDDGRRTVKIPVRLSDRAIIDNRVRFRTRAGSAEPGNDFVAKIAHLHVPIGDRRAVISVTVVGDVKHEQLERFTVRFDHARQLRIGTKQVTVTVHDSDPRPEKGSRVSSRRGDKNEHGGHQERRRSDR